MNNQFITIEEAKRNGALYSMGYKTNINRVNLIAGAVCVAYGVATLPLPTGSIFAICGGFGLMLNPISLKKIVKGLYDDIKFKVGVML